MLASEKKIWIDLDNSPHVLFFNPIIKELKCRGYQVVTTVRNHAQICELADMFKMEYKVFGRHYGKNKALKIYGFLRRTLQFVPYIFKEKPDLAFSHGSRPQILAAELTRIPYVNTIDYEYGAQIPFVKPTLTILPQVLYEKQRELGVKRIASYPGIKEDVYIKSYVPDKLFLKQFGSDNEKIIVTIRPPASDAHYHNPKSDDLFSDIIHFVCGHVETCIIIAPRTKKQENLIKKTWPDYIDAHKLIIPKSAVNGLDLIWHSDLVISGGGTMIREAAALNVPAYSFFQGKVGAVDRYLVEIGKLILIENQKDVNTKIKVSHRFRPAASQCNGSPALESILCTLDSLITTSR